MKRVLIIHPDGIPHYRVPIYNYLSTYLRQRGFDILVTSDGVRKGCPDRVEFDFVQMKLGALSIARYVAEHDVDVIIDFMVLKHSFLFPTYVLVKGFLNRKIVYWGQGRDLLDPNSLLKNAAYDLQLTLCDAILLYADHLRRFVPRRLQHKVFVANNTLCLESKSLSSAPRDNVLSQFGITTRKNIICMGRMQRRKRIDVLVEAVRRLNRADIGLILVGPDDEGILDGFEGDNIYKLGPVYDERRFDLLRAADVYCLPGAVGLSIVDAFHCGLPLITEAGDESAEIMYLEHGVNGFIVPRGDIDAMAEKLALLLDDDELRGRFSEAARRCIAEKANINRMCEGFAAALAYVTGGRR